MSTLKTLEAWDYEYVLHKIEDMHMISKAKYSDAERRLISEYAQKALEIKLAKKEVEIANEAMRQMQEEQIKKIDCLANPTPEDEKAGISPREIEEPKKETEEPF